MTISPPLPLKDMANAVRMLAVDAVEKAQSGHPGMPLGMADVATVLFANWLVFDPEDPAWPDRDRFVLSAGHGSMLLYALLHMTGYESVSLEEIRRFRQLDSLTPGHPEYGHTPGVETTTGPLSQGLATAVGMALAEQRLAARFGGDLVNHRTYVMASDGDLMEGLSQEAIALAGHLCLNKLIVLWDDNRISIDGDLALSDSLDQKTRFESAGWEVMDIDGHDREAIGKALAFAQTVSKPFLIACRTHIGYGAPTKQGSAASHGSPLGEKETEGLRQALAWPHPPFVIPHDIRDAWRTPGKAGKERHKAWLARLESSPHREEFQRCLEGIFPENLKQVFEEHRASVSLKAPSVATRKASGDVLEKISPFLPEFLGGSADLSGSNNTHAPDMTSIGRGDFSGRYLHYGIREHAMAAAMNGMAVHGSIIPYGGTFLVFSDYARPAIRLSALMKQRVIYVFTHDSIGLGEDGPTHQPIEHLAALRAIPHLHVYRPCDAVETTECWALALERKDGPNALILTRQSLPTLRTLEPSEHQDEDKDEDKTAGLLHQNLSARGAYLLSPCPQGLEERAVLLATGSEVHLALKAQESLTSKKTGVRVVSLPCWERFEEQSAAYQRETLGTNLPVIGVEAASSFGWGRWTGQQGGFVGLSDFGASAPAEDLFSHFNMTSKAIVEKALQCIK